MCYICTARWFFMWADSLLEKLPCNQCWSLILRTAGLPLDILIVGLCLITTKFKQIFWVFFPDFWISIFTETIHIQNNLSDALLSLAKCYWLQTTTQSLCSLPGLLIGDSFPTHLVMKDVSFTFSLLCMGMVKIQTKEIFVKKQSLPHHNLLDHPLHEE